MGFKETAPLLPSLEEKASAYSDVDYLETWEGMEDCVNLGLAKSIGLSNFNSQQIDRILQNSKIPPAVNQIEVNPNLTQKKLIEFCQNRSIVVTGFCPLGRVSNIGSREDFPTPTIMDPKVIEMAEKYNKTPAQIVLNYLVQIRFNLLLLTISFR